MLVLTLMRWMSLPTLAQLFYVWMYAGKLKSEIGTYIKLIAVPPLPANIVELRTRITAAVAKLTPEMLRTMWQETHYRWEVCRITNGSHIEP